MAMDPPPAAADPAEPVAPVDPSTDLPGDLPSPPAPADSNGADAEPSSSEAPVAAPTGFEYGGGGGSYGQPTAGAEDGSNGSNGSFDYGGRRGSGTAPAPAAAPTSPWPTYYNWQVRVGPPGRAFIQSHPGSPTLPDHPVAHVLQLAGGEAALTSHLSPLTCDTHATPRRLLPSLTSPSSLNTGRRTRGRTVPSRGRRPSTAPWMPTAQRYALDTATCIYILLQKILHHRRSM